MHARSLLTYKDVARGGRGRAGRRAAVVQEIRQRKRRGDQLSFLLEIEKIQTVTSLGRHYGDGGRGLVLVVRGARALGQGGARGRHQVNPPGYAERHVGQNC